MHILGLGCLPFKIPSHVLVKILSDDCVQAEQLRQEAEDAARTEQEKAKLFEEQHAVSDRDHRDGASEVVVDLHGRR